MNDGDSDVRRQKKKPAAKSPATVGSKSVFDTDD